MHEYFIDVMAKDRLAEIRALAAREWLAREARPPRRPLRIALGAGLVWLGQWLGGGSADWAERHRPA
jgi:hypothetical protein